MLHNSYFVLTGVGDSCRISVYICKLYTSVGEERESYFFCFRLLVIVWFLFGGVSSSSWCLGYFTVALPGPSI